MTSDPYINSLHIEIAELKAQNEILRSKLLINQEHKLHMISHMADIMKLMDDL